TPLRLRKRRRDARKLAPMCGTLCFLWEIIMGIKIVGGNFSGNRRDGIRVEGDVDVEIINPNSENNGGQGINIIQSPNIMRQLGLPDDTNPEELVRLLIAVRSAPGNQKEGIIKN